MSKFDLHMGRMIKRKAKLHQRARGMSSIPYNLCTKSSGKFWFGDIDLTDDIEEAKLALTAEKGESIYVLRERDARFMNEAKPLLENAVAIVTPDGNVGLTS